MLWLMLGGIVFAACGALFFIKPAWIWKLTEEWKSCRADEPSGLYKFSIKFGGVILFLLGMVMMILPLLPD